jgi:hypothetical protein
MSSRTPRRAFAASFVITMAALPACRVQTVDHRAAPLRVPGQPHDHRGSPDPHREAGGEHRVHPAHRRGPVPPRRDVQPAAAAQGRLPGLSWPAPGGSR